MARAKAPSDPSVVQSHNDLIIAVGRVGDLQRKNAERKARVDARVARLMAALKFVSKPIGTQIKKLLKDIQRYAEAHRAELTDDGARKSQDVGSGTVGWRNDPPSVKVSDEEAAIARLHELGLGWGVRTVEEVDKEAILAYHSKHAKLKPDTPEHALSVEIMELLALVTEVTVVTGVEQFFVTPKEVKAPVTPEGDEVAA